MTTITEKQFDDLVTRIYNVLISGPEVGLGELGNCRDAATEIVNEWIDYAPNELVLEDNHQVFEIDTDL